MMGRVKGSSGEFERHWGGSRGIWVPGSPIANLVTKPTRRFSRRAQLLDQRNGVFTRVDKINGVFTQVDKINGLSNRLNGSVTQVDKINGLSNKVTKYADLKAYTRFTTTVQIESTQAESQWIVGQAYSQHLQYLEAIKSSAKDLSLPIFEIAIDLTVRMKLGRSLYLSCNKGRGV